MQKIVVIGSPGSGKSTFAPALARRLSLPIYHLDALYWKPGWVETPHGEWRALQIDLVAQDCWVIDGNYSSTIDIRLEAADTVIFFDMPRWLCVWRATRRVLHYRGKQRPDMAPGCYERIDRQFLEFLLYIWTFKTRQRPAIWEKLAALKDKRAVILRTPAQARAFLHRVEVSHGI